MIAIEKYISDHYTDQTMSAASIAEQFKISPSYLSRIFKADMGIGIVEYIHRIRVEAAKKLCQSQQPKVPRKEYRSRAQLFECGVLQ